MESPDVHEMGAQFSEAELDIFFSLQHNPFLQNPTSGDGGEGFVSNGSESYLASETLTRRHQPSTSFATALPAAVTLTRVDGVPQQYNHFTPYAPNNGQPWTLYPSSNSYTPIAGGDINTQSWPITGNTGQNLDSPFPPLSRYYAPVNLEETEQNSHTSADGYTISHGGYPSPYYPYAGQSPSYASTTTTQQHVHRQPQMPNAMTGPGISTAAPRVESSPREGEESSPIPGAEGSATIQDKKLRNKVAASKHRLKKIRKTEETVRYIAEIETSIAKSTNDSKTLFVEYHELMNRAFKRLEGPTMDWHATFRPELERLIAVRAKNSDRDKETLGAIQKSRLELDRIEKETREMKAINRKILAAERKSKAELEQD